MADLDAFVTIASADGEVFNNSSNNDLLIYTDSTQQNILIGNDSYAPHVIFSNGKIEMFKNATIQGDLDVTGFITQSGGTLGSKWRSFFNTIYTEQSNVCIGMLRSNSLLTLCDPDPFTPSNAVVSFTNNVVSDGFALVGLSNTGDMILWHTSNYFIRLGTSNREVMTITDTGKVGISNPNPAYTFDVEGDVNFTGDLYQNGIIYSGKQWINNGASMYCLNSNIGIGVDTPKSRLHLHRNNSLNVLATFTNAITGSNDGIIVGLDSNGNGLVWHQQYYDLRFGTSNQEVLTITKDGIVGIKTSTPDPSYDVHIDGILKTNSITVLQSLYTYDFESTGQLHAKNTAIFESNASFNSTTTFAGDVTVNGLTTINGPVTINDNVSITSNVDLLSNTTLCNCSIYDVCTVYSNLHVANSTGSAYFFSIGGNLGLNTENPAYTLDVNGPVYALGFCNLLVNSTSNSSLHNAPTANALRLVTNNLSNVEQYSIYASNAVYYTSNLLYNTWYGYTSNSLYTIKSNLGIGTTTPLFNLDVTDSTNTSTFITIGNSTNRCKIGISNDLMVLMNNGVKPIIFGNNDTEHMRMTSNGYLGVNKSNDINYPIDVNGSVNVSGGYYLNGSLVNSGKWSSNADGLYVTSNVGIQTFPSATKALNLLGDAEISGSLTASTFSGDGSLITNINAANVSLGVTAKKVLVGNATGNGVSTPTALHWDDLAERFGINTSNPGYTLDVNGTINATNFRGDGANINGLNAANISGGITASKLLVANSAGTAVTTPFALHFDSTSNLLGIGTATPCNALEVVGDTYVWSNLSLGNQLIITDTLFPNTLLSMTNPTDTLSGITYTFTSTNQFNQWDGSYLYNGYGNGTFTFDEYLAGDFVGTVTTGSIGGHYSGIVGSSNFILRGYNFTGVSNDTAINFPNKLYVMGSLDDSNWTQVDYFSVSSASTYTASDPPSFTRQFNNTNAYKYYRVVFNTLLSDDFFTLEEFSWYIGLTNIVPSSTLYFNSSNIGINKTSPATTLDVVGDINFTGNLTQNGIPWSSGGAFSNDGSNVYVLSPSNVGIGTSNPQAQLHVTDSLRVDGYMQFAGFQLTPGNINLNSTQVVASTSNIMGYCNLDYGTSNGTELYISGGTANDLFRWKTAGVERMRLTGAGNLGIGTSTPAYTLDAVGTINATAFRGDGANITNLNAGNIASGIVTASRGGTGVSSITANKLIVGNTSGTTIAQPTNLHWDNTNSRLGIGTSTPGYVLDVNGFISTTGVRFGTIGPIRFAYGVAVVGGAASVSFGFTFGGSPSVTATTNVDDASYIHAAHVYNISTTGFSIRLTQYGPGGFYNNDNKSVQWIAIGPA